MNKFVDILVILMFLLSSISITAKDVKADPILNVDPNPPCDTPGEPYCTIQAAIDHAGPGDTILVAAGTYAENVVLLDKQNLVIHGAGDTTIVQPAAGIGFAIENSDGITIEYFKIMTTGLDAHGIWVGGTPNGYGDSDNLVIQSNTIDIGGKSSGIYAEQVNPAHNGWTISGNTISAPNLGVDLELYDVDSATVSGNTFDISGSVAVVYSSELSNIGSSTFSTNIFNGNGNVGGVTPGFWIESDFQTGDGSSTVNGVTITGNTFNDWTNAAIQIGEADSNSHYSQVSSVIIHQNKFLKSSHPIDLKSYISEQVNATHNWWGDTDPSNDVTGNVNYFPFYLEEEMTNLSECIANSECSSLNTECADGVCTGGQCQQIPKPAQTECHAAAGACDVAEVCDGVNPQCPADALKPNTEECRAAVGLCDIAELCTGQSAECPVDAVKPAQTVCRDVAGDCDLAELCDGLDPACPADSFKDNSVVCAQGGQCTLAANCDGLSAACPAPVAKDDSTPCDDSLKCTLEDVCTAGVCAGSPKVCTDNFPCTNDSCDSATGNCTFTPDNSKCDDSVFCNGLETCNAQTGCVSGTAVDCSANSIPGINTCINNPDNNPFTLDFAAPFISVCDEQARGCTTGTLNLTHQCNVASCGAACDPTHVCTDSSCSQTYDDSCSGKMLVEYDNDRILDSTTITDTKQNTCLDSCSCTQNQVNCNAPQINSYCVKGVCGATCETNEDCGAKCIGEIRYFNAGCNSCDCSYQTEDCNLKDAWYDTDNLIWVDIGQCKEKEQRGQEYRDYSCAVDSCSYIATQTQFVDTGNQRLKEGCKLLKIESPEPKVYDQQLISVKLTSISSAKLSYSIDHKGYKLACVNCGSYQRDVQFSVGPHLLEATAKYEDGSVLYESVWFAVAAPEKKQAGKTVWQGVPNQGLFIDGQMEILETLNFRLPRSGGNLQSLKEEVLDTVIKVHVNNLPGIEENENFVLWMHKSGTNEYLRLGSLTLNRLHPATDDPLDTRIIGQFTTQGMIVDRSLLARFDGAFVEVEPRGYSSSPNGNWVAYFNKPPTIS